MKKTITTIIIIVISAIVFLLGFSYKQRQEPNTFYKVYLKGEVIGVISSKQELEEYIDKQNEEYKKKYNVSKVNAPNGLEIKKLTTYDQQVESIKKVYEKIVDQEPFTIPGLEFNLKNDDRINKIYVIDEQVFKEAVEMTQKTFVGTDDYNTYKDNVQQHIQTTGKMIEDIYVEDQITMKKVNIPVTEKIYTDENELSRFLVFGPNEKQTVYNVKLGDTISDIAYENKISVEEFMISNPSFTSEKNMLFPGQEVIISATDPQISIVTIEDVTEDKVIKYQTEFLYDANAVKGDDKVTQAGEDGLERVNQKVKSINGVILSIDTLKKEELKPVTNEIVIKGEKDVPDTGSWNNWYWPTSPSGWRLSDGFGWRWLQGVHDLHIGQDIGGIDRKSVV